MCGRKAGYQNARAAHQAANVYEERRGEPLRVYRCPFCTRWHLTSKEGAAA